MPSIRQIRGRIKAAKNIQQITKAMKMVAAARLRRSQERMLAARPYAQTVAGVMRGISGQGVELGQLQLQPAGHLLGGLGLGVAAHAAD